MGCGSGGLGKVGEHFLLARPGTCLGKSSESTVEDSANLA